MIRKSQLFLAVAALVGMNAAFAACNTTQWGQGATSPPGGAVVGTPTPGNPTAGDPDGVVRRYSGQCGLRSTGANNYVQDGLPLAEASFIARFYVYTGVSGGTGANVYNALSVGTSVADYSILSVDFTGTAFAFKNRAGASVFTIPAAGNKWYAVEVKYTRATNTVDAKVRENTGAEVTGTGNTFTVDNAADGVDYVQLGWIGGTATGEIHVDAYESRRSTDIGRLCRGDANGDLTLNVGDRGAVTTEVLGTALANGQPDCNHDGIVNVGDRGCITTRVLNADNCTANL
jgi:hypothetical protein